MTKKKSEAKNQAPESQAQVNANPRSRAGDKVIICSKLEMPLQLQLEGWREVVRKDKQTTWTEKESFKYGPVVTINGTAFPMGDGAVGLTPPEMSDGVAFTFGIDAGWWERWCAEHADYPPLRDGFIYAATNRENAKAHAAEIKDLRTGFGPLEHSKDSQGNDVITDYRRQRKTPGKNRATAGMSESYDPADYAADDADNTELAAAE